MSTPSCILPVRLLSTLALALLLSGCVASSPPEPPLPDDSITSSKPWGNSDRPESPHFDDLTELFAGNGYKELWFDRSDVEAAAVSETSLAYP